MGSSAGSFNCSIGWHLALLSDRGGVPNKERQGSMHLKPRTAGWAAVTVLALFLVGLTGFWAFDFGQRRQLEVSRATERVTAAGYALTQQMTSVLSDLIYLSQLGSFQRWRGTGGADRPALELDWQAYLQDHPYIQQVRLLNEKKKKLEK